MRRRPWSVGVLIPARDEELLLPRCLRSVIAAIKQVADRVAPHVIVVADSSVDRTTEIARDFLGSRGTVLTASVGTVGTARRMAAEHLLSQQSGPLNRFWLANTDADCIVPPAWLADQLGLAGQGIEAIAGTVNVDSFEEHEPEVRERFRASYVIAGDGTHPHVHGANLGVRADAYCRAGGWMNLATAEDHDLWGRLKSTGAKTLSTARIEVVTSGRRVGRAPHGFAQALAAHNKTQALA